MKINNYDKRRLRLMSKSITGNNILDIGHAAIPNHHLSQYNCTGYDIMKTKKKIYNKEIQGDTKDIKTKLHNQKFDTIICGEFIEHLENPYEFLRDIHELLTDNGRLIITTPNPLSFPLFICELFQIKKFFYTQHHKYLFLPRWVNRMLEQSGFSLIKIRSVGFWFFSFALPMCPTFLSYQLIYIVKKSKKND